MEAQVYINLLFPFSLIFIGGGAGGEAEGAVAPELHTRGQTVSNANHFAELVEWWLQERKKT